MSDCAEEAEDYPVIHFIKKQDLRGKVSSISCNIGYFSPFPYNHIPSCFWQHSIHKKVIYTEAVMNLH